MKNGRALADAFRERGLPVVFVTVNYGQDNGLQVRVPSDWDMTFEPPVGWDQVDPRLGTHPADVVVVKHVFNGFHGTDLDLILRRMGVTTLVVGGIATHAGVEATVRAAHDHGYRQVLVEDAMSAMTDQHHSHAVTQIFPMLGEVASTELVLADLAESR